MHSGCDRFSSSAKGRKRLQLLVEEAGSPVVRGGEMRHDAGQLQTLRRVHGTGHRTCLRRVLRPQPAHPGVELHVHAGRPIGGGCLHGRARTPPATRRRPRPRRGRPPARCPSALPSPVSDRRSRRPAARPPPGRSQPPATSLHRRGRRGRTAWRRARSRPPSRPRTAAASPSRRLSIAQLRSTAPRSTCASARTRSALPARVSPPARTGAATAATRASAQRGCPPGSRPLRGARRHPRSSAICVPRQLSLLGRPSGPAAQGGGQGRDHVSRHHGVGAHPPGRLAAGLLVGLDGGAGSLGTRRAPARGTPPSHRSARRRCRPSPARPRRRG